VASERVDAAEAGELTRDRAGEPFGIHSRAERHDGEDARPGRRRRQSAGDLKLGCELAEQRAGEVGVV